mmetsp:Transcript_60445/g.174398  ORF Transcript_60445/g.174398 Transcript_60445/m.174398 type:complete len:224 (+) Transcript_60445:405-1076(+)
MRVPPEPWMPSARRGPPRRVRATRRTRRTTGSYPAPSCSSLPNRTSSRRGPAAGSAEPRRRHGARSAPACATSPAGRCRSCQRRGATTPTTANTRAGRDPTPRTACTRTCRKSPPPTRRSARARSCPPDSRRTPPAVLTAPRPAARCGAAWPRCPSSRSWDRSRRPPRSPPSAGPRAAADGATRSLDGQRTPPGCSPRALRRHRGRRRRRRRRLWRSAPQSAA